MKKLLPPALVVLRKALLTFSLCALLIPSTGIMAQALPEETEDAPPPGLDIPPRRSPGAPPSTANIPPPPTFTPPPRPTSTPGARPTVAGQAARDTTENQAQSAGVANLGNLVNENDPRMRQTVGLIRIPGMGTNEVLEMLENFTNKPILRQQTLPAVNITFFSQGAMTRGEAINAIVSLLALNGIAITEVGERFLKAVPANIITTQVPPVWEGTTLGAAPSQKIFEKIFELEFLSAPEALPLLQPFMSQGSPIAFEKSNLLLITDALINLQRMERLLQVLDRPSPMRNIKMMFFQLRHTSSQDVLRRLQQMQQGPLRRQLENNTTFDADDRSNQIIVFTHPANEQLIRQLMEQLDLDVAPLTSTRIFNIRYAKAPDVVSLIEQVVSGQQRARQQAPGQQQAGATAAAQRAAAARAQAAAQAAAQSSAAREGANLQFSDFMTIVADERANTVVASGTSSDLSFLEDLINQIDVLLAQVRIEVVITEVRLSEGQERGIDSFGFGYGRSPGSTTITTNAGTAPDQKVVVPSDIFGVSFPGGITWGPAGFSMAAVLNAVRRNSNISVLSAPTIVTTHNREATIAVGERRPVITGTTTFANTDGTTRQDIQQQDISLQLKVTPLIGVDGVVQLEIEQTVESVIDNVLINGVQNPVIGSRRANSYVSVRNGELVVLGGLQSVDNSVTESRMAIIGSIPVIGDIFKRQVRDRVRTELLIFIRPVIIADTDAASLDARRQIEIIEASEDIDNFLEHGTFRREAEPVEIEENQRARPSRFR
ncbi:MAG: hypothetical protein LR015_04210 [Verrucomicrobia bacterium]|nr:hypothetical protein [Verrucomicrobiota bacterium]